MPDESRSPRIVGLGTATLDYLFISPTIAPGGQAAMREHTIEGGGLVATALVAAARLGAKTELRSWVGDDAEGEAVLAGLQREGVGTRHVQIVPGQRTAVAFIHVEEHTGERTIFFGGLPRVTPEQQAALADLPLEADVLLVDASWPEASIRIAQRAMARGIPVVGDFCPSSDVKVELAGLMTALIVPRASVERLAPRVSWADRLRLLADTGAEFVAITAGAEGCYYIGGEGVCNQPAFSAPICDTTGAGDVFHGAFAYALGRQWPPGRSVEFASAVAALSCRALGGRRGIPTWEETCAFLRTEGSGQWEW